MMKLNEQSAIKNPQSEILNNLFEYYFLRF
ncbi:MAG: hypothetical protein QG611_122 [Bacteroidota bacterium]|nr:hypothetical protein [Bacteroidota bacterium]